MITFGTAGNAIVGYGGVEVLVPAGTWQLAGATNFNVGGTNVALNVRSGATVFVDAAGFYTVEDGPDLSAAFLVGFGIVFGWLGVLSATRWVLKVLFRSTGVARVDD
jgi:hypothetical protein